MSNATPDLRLPSRQHSILLPLLSGTVILPGDRGTCLSLGTLRSGWTRIRDLSIISRRSIPLDYTNTWFPALRCRSRNRFRKNRVRSPYLPFRMPLLGRVRGSSATGPGGRPPSFPRKRVGGAPGVWLRTERQVRKNRTRSYMNGSTVTELTETENVIFLRKLRSSYGILTDERNSYVIFSTDNGGTETEERIRNGGNHA